MRSSNTVLVCIFCSVVAAAIGFAAGALLIYPNRSRVNAEAEATVAVAKKELLAENNTLKKEIQKLKQSHGIDIEKLAAAIEICRWRSRLDSISTMRDKAYKVHPWGSREYLATLTCLQKECEDVVTQITTIKNPFTGEFKDAYEIFELEAIGVFRFLECQAELVRDPTNKDNIKKLEVVSEALNEAHGIAYVTEALLLEDCVEGLGAHFFGKLDK